MLPPYPIQIFANIRHITTDEVVRDYCDLLLSAEGHRAETPVVERVDIEQMLYEDEP